MAKYGKSSSVIHCGRSGSMVCTSKCQIFRVKFHKIPFWFRKLKSCHCLAFIHHINLPKLPNHPEISNPSIPSSFHPFVATSQVNPGKGKRIRAANLCSSRRSPGIPNPFEPSMPQFQGSCISPTVISHHLTLDSSLNQLKIKVVNDCDSVRFVPGWSNHELGHSSQHLNGTFIWVQQRDPILPMACQEVTELTVHGQVNRAAFSLHLQWLSASFEHVSLFSLLLCGFLGKGAGNGTHLTWN